MLVILRNKTKKKILVTCKFLAILVLGFMIAGHLYNMSHGRNVMKEGWLSDDRPSGNPMRVENIKTEPLDNDPSVFSQFVVKIKDFYHGE